MRLLIMLALLCASLPGYAASFHDVGMEAQGYPAGIISALRGTIAFDANHELSARLGYNLTDRQDFGENDDEEGGGFGGGLGYRYYFGKELSQWFGGGKVDLWALEIDWIDGGSSGTTDVMVLQPTVEAGYMFSLQYGWRIGLSASGGFEINVDTDGQDVGEGLIGLFGISVSNSF